MPARRRPRPIGQPFVGRRTRSEPGGDSTCFQRRGSLSRPRLGRACGAAAPRGRVRIGDLSIVGRDFQETEEPCGFVSLGDYVKAGAKTGASFGGLFGLLLGAAFLILPGVGPVVVAGPIAAAVLAGLEGVVAGTAWAAWPARSSAGMFRRTGRSNTRRRSRGASFSSWSGPLPEVVARARSLLAAKGPEHVEVYEPPAS